MPFTSPIWTLSTIITEVRGITGRPDSSMISDQQMANYINYYYQFVLPKELKIFWGYSYYQFFTQANVDQYLAPSTIQFQTLNPQVWVDGFPVCWYISPDLFYSDWPAQENKQTVAQADGMNNSFTFQITDFPVLIGSVYVTDGTQIAQDNGTGGFIDPTTGNALSGSINYTAGTVSGLGFTNIPVANAQIVVTYQTYLPNRPQSILYFPSQPLTDSSLPTLQALNMFVLRPVPDQVYLVKMQGIQVPQPLIAVDTTDVTTGVVTPGSVPFRSDLGPLIALGASLHIFKIFNQMDQYEQYLPEYYRFKDVCMQDTYEELFYERSVPAF